MRSVFMRFVLLLSDLCNADSDPTFHCDADPDAVQAEIKQHEDNCTVPAAPQPADRPWTGKAGA